MTSPALNILLLEDNPYDAELIERELRRGNLEFSATRVDTEPGFRDALVLAPPDVILSDYNLPDFDGMTALATAREVAPHIPFIFVSGGIGEERATQALLEGATDYILKDRPSRLPAAVTRAIEERREKEQHLHAQEGLRLSNERFRLSVKATQEVIFDWNFATNQVAVSDALEFVWGYEVPDLEVTPEWFFDRIHPEDVDPVRSSVTLAIERVEPWTADYRLRRANGEYGYVYVRTEIVTDQDGTPRRMVGAILDVTEQKLAEERLRQSELRFRKIAQAASDAIVVSDDDRKVVFLNDAAVMMFGYPMDELLGKSLDILVPDRYRGQHTQILQGFDETGGRPPAGHRAELTGRRADGSEFPLEISRSSWSTEGRMFYGATMRDITARVAAERRERLQLIVTRTLSESTRLGDAVSAILRSVSSELKFQVAFYWAWDESVKALTCKETRLGEQLDSPDFMNQNMIVREGDGVPWAVWSNGRAIWIDVDHDLDSARQQNARKSGISSGFAFPIVEEGIPAGVIEFYTTGTSLVRDEEFLLVLEDLGRRIGDFSLRRQSDEQLIRREAELAEAQRIARIGVWDYHYPSRTFMWSAATRELYGIRGKRSNDLDESLVNADRYMELVHPDDHEHVRNAMAPPFTSDTADFRHRVVTGDGELRAMHCRFKLTEGTLEQPVRVIGTKQDITEQYLAEQTIRELVRKNELLLDSVAEGIFALDHKGTVQFVNQAALRLTGWSSKEFLDHPAIHQLIHHSYPDGKPYPEEDCPMMQTCKDGKVRRGIEVFWTKSGEQLPMDFSCAPMEEAGVVTGCVVAFSDITERQRLERQLEQANRVTSLGRVAANIAHEFNNVLMGIQPFAEVIRRHGAGNPKIVKAAEQITGSVKRGKRVSQEVLRFAQPAQPEFKVVDLTGWLADMVPELRGLAGSGVLLEFELPDHAVTARFDVGQIQQVVTNLVLNARDASSHGGRIFVRLENGGGRDLPGFTTEMAFITVRDQGAGMAPQILEQIFDPLFTTKRSGTGLGLAIVQQIVGAHHGWITVESEEGKGTSFELALPVVDAEVHEAIVPESNGSAMVVRRLLLVEDEPVVAAGLSILLELEGIVTLVVDNGGQVVEAVESFRPEAVILDLGLPDMPGTEVYKLISARWPTLPVVFSTGHGDEKILEHALNSSSVRFIRKPYELSALLRTLQEVVPLAGKAELELS